MDSFMDLVVGGVAKFLHHEDALTHLYGPLEMIDDVSEQDDTGIKNLTTEHV